MNPYGEPQSARARARVPSGPGAPAPGGQQSRGEAPDSYRTPSARPAGGRAQVGGAAAGQAGRASVGSARVGGQAGVDGYGPVARAAVRPVPGYGSFDDADDLSGPGGGSGGGGGGGRGGGRGSGGGGGGKDLSKAAKRRRRANVLTAAAAVMVIMLGAGVVGGTYFFDGVKFEEPAAETQRTQILESDRKTVLTTIGENRTLVPYKSINPLIGEAVMAAEDKNFLDHGGIDMKGIARAAWNNFTGGSTQGASTITQQYARHAADIKDISYNRKLREAVLARKIESTYEKDEILGRYLNSVFFGRGAYGIEAAVKAFYGPNRSSVTPPGKPGAITAAEAAVLASVIKQPNPVPGGHQGYDPYRNPTGALERWTYTMNNMVEKRWITPQERAAAVYPKTVKKPSKGGCAACVDNEPVGMVVRHVIAELRDMGISEEDQAKGGLEITTTIDPEVQALAEQAAQRSSDVSPMNNKPKSYQAALVAINPTNGRVMGYYGGDDPTGLDFAGYMDGETHKILDYGGKSAGSTFKVYTLAAGLQQNLSFKSRWDSTLERVGGGKISNAGKDPGSLCDGLVKSCELEQATVQSYNFPFYWIANKIGPSKVVEAAKNAGITHMWTDAIPENDNKAKMVDLRKDSAASWKGDFAEEVGFGQYRVIPLEHANGIATIINGGVYHKAHFIQSVRKRDPSTGKLQPFKNDSQDGVRAFPADQMSNLNRVLQEIPGHVEHKLRSDRPAAAKTGTWEFNTKGGNGDAWMIGGIPQMAVAVWVGGKGDRVKLKAGANGTGKDMFGGTTPGAIWEMFVDSVTRKLNMPVEKFPDPVDTGDATALGNGEQPPPQQQVDQGNSEFCRQFPLATLCGNQNGQNQNGKDQKGQNQDGQGNQGQGNQGQGNQGQGNQGQGNQGQGNQGQGNQGQGNQGQGNQGQGDQGQGDQGQNDDQNGQLRN